MFRIIDSTTVIEYIHDKSRRDETYHKPKCDTKTREASHSNYQFSRKHNYDLKPEIRNKM